jgi:uncharacterized protein involved in exopolysaccharide biosynthesis
LSRKSWLLAGALLGGLIGLAVALGIKDQYRATTQLLIDPRDLRVLKDEVSPGTVSSDAATAFVESQARVIASDSIKRRVIATEALDRDPEFDGSAPEGTIETLIRRILPKKDHLDPMVGALLTLDKKLQVRRSERTFVIDIHATSEDAIKAARIANAFAETYVDEQGRVRSDIARKAQGALTARLDELRDSVRRAEEKVQAFKDRNNIVDIGGKLVGDEQLTQAASLQSQAKARVAEAKAKYDQSRLVRVSSVEAGAVPEAVASNTITAMRAQLGAALARETELSTTLAGQHPALVAAQSQVRDARRQIADELTRISQAAKAEYDRARATELAINQRFETLKKETQTASGATVQLRELEREVEASRAVYQAFLLRARETGEQASVNTSNVRIISEAIPPVFRSNVSRKLIIIGGIMAGLAAALAAALARGVLLGLSPPPATARGPAFSPVLGDPAAQPHNRRADDATVVTMRGNGAERAAPAGWRRASGEGPAKPPLRIATPADLAAALGTQVVADLPKIGRRWALGRTEPQATVFHGRGLPLEAWDRPDQPFAKAIEALLRNPEGTPAAGGNRKLVVLGLQPGAGSSTVAVNLVLAAARQGRTPLLVDAVSGPTGLTERLAPGADLGLADVVNGRAGFVRAALQDDQTGVFFLPGQGAAREDETIAPGALERGLFPFIRRFDPVVIDAGVWGVTTLAGDLVAGADELLLVLRASQASGVDVASLRRGLGLGSTKLRGLVVMPG